MTTDKSKKGLMGGKLEMMNRPLRFIQSSMSAMPAMSVMPAMPPGRSGSDNAPKKPEHLRKKKLVSGVRKKRGHHSKLDT